MFSLLSGLLLFLPAQADEGPPLLEYLAALASVALVLLVVCVPARRE